MNVENSKQAWRKESYYKRNYWRWELFLPWRHCVFFYSVLKKWKVETKNNEQRVFRKMDLKKNIGLSFCNLISSVFFLSLFFHAFFVFLFIFWLAYGNILRDKIDQPQKLHIKPSLNASKSFNFVLIQLTF